jgi:3-phosphoshikimate 1-carboxyvinyltransferase
VIQKFEKINKIDGTLFFMGDKSISHRALIISALANGKSYIQNLSSAEDVQSTVNCLNNLGVEINEENNRTVVKGRGFKGLKKPGDKLNAGNSGTTARLLSGVLAAQDFDSTVVGDKSLSARPMNRIIEPLNQMGARIAGIENETLSLQIEPALKLNAINYELPVASAQVKSAILFAGLHIDESTEVVELNQTRDHTENLLNLDVKKSGEKIISRVSVINYPEATEYLIPGDISSAMFFVILTLFTKNSQLRIKNVSLNISRTAAINILIKMGARIEIEITGESNREKYGDLIIKSSELKNIKIEKEIIPSIIDEIPILAVAGLFAEGEFKIDSISELRVKESDRIKSLCSNFSLLGLVANQLKDSFSLSGEIKIPNPTFNSFGDHRIAMTFSILSCLLDEGGRVDDIESVSVSNPEFLNQLNSIIH